MSSDEEAAVIGRMVIERKNLQQRATVLHQEIMRIANGLSTLAKELQGGNSMFSSYRMSHEQAALLDAPKLDELLIERETVSARYNEISEALRSAGLSN